MPPHSPLLLCASKRSSEAGCLALSLVRAACTPLPSPKVPGQPQVTAGAEAGGPSPTHLLSSARPPTRRRAGPARSGPPACFPAPAQPLPAQASPTRPDAGGPRGHRRQLDSRGQAGAPQRICCSRRATSRSPPGPSGRRSTLGARAGVGQDQGGTDPWAHCPPHPQLSDAAAPPTMEKLSPQPMKQCNLSGDPWPQVVAHIFYAYLGTLLVVGLLLNGVALWVFCCRMRTWTETRVYMTNLAVADVCLLCALPFMLRSLQQQSAEDTLFCQLSQGIYLANRYMSISLITAIAVDRYVAVRHPLRARRLRSPRQAAAVCAVLWLLVGSSLVARWALGVQEGGFCFGRSTRLSSSSVIISLLGFYLPLAVLAFCSLQVVTGLARRPAADAGQQEATHKAACMVWANLAVFVVCFLPMHVVLTVRLAAGWQSCDIRPIFIASRLSDANCCLDAICYYFMAREFQEASPLPALPSAKAHRSQDSGCVTLASEASSWGPRTCQDRL
ncbi:G-protein coupled receptor 35 isoform X2 [Choloepus didactylus]|uniref:G-protein coupled receptor 35 isoform X2 n=1 Tax=Choloepus didactylus TaxID=27675 RepID=UPI0018A005FB|nr:G-protein coupled receptor 35 isoform X2 [Choloepus didactylus]